MRLRAHRQPRDGATPQPRLTAIANPSPQHPGAVSEHRGSGTASLIDCSRHEGACPHSDLHRSARTTYGFDRRLHSKINRLALSSWSTSMRSLLSGCLIAAAACTGVPKQSGDDVSSTETLLVAVSGSGGGTVSSAPAGISCVPDCSEVYD